MKRHNFIKIKNRLFKMYGNLVYIKRETYHGLYENAVFVDKEFGEYRSEVRRVLAGAIHPLRQKAIKVQKTALRALSKKCRTIPIEQIKEKIFKIHGDAITIDESTYINTHNKSRFINKTGEEWWAWVFDVLKGGIGRANYSKNKTTSIEQIKEKIFKIHGDIVTIDESTYINTKAKARFVDKDYGEWWTPVYCVINQKQGHKRRGLEKKRETCRQRYGYSSVAQVPKFALKGARASDQHFLRYHWKTGAELVCQASYEPKVIDYLNQHKIDFEWQSQVFTMPNGKTYRPDLFLINENKWIEIKGYMRPTSQLKWDWFKAQFPTAELWNKPKLTALGIL